MTLQSILQTGRRKLSDRRVGELQRIEIRRKQEEEKRHVYWDRIKGFLSNNIPEILMKYVEIDRNDPVLTNMVSIPLCISKAYPVLLKVQLQGEKATWQQNKHCAVSLPSVPDKIAEIPEYKALKLPASKGACEFYITDVEAALALSQELFADMEVQKYSSDAGTSMQADTDFLEHDEEINFSIFGKDLDEPE